LTLVYFSVKGDYLERLLPVGAERVISGHVEYYGSAPQIAHPDYVVHRNRRTRSKAIEPVYPLTAGLSSRIAARAVNAALERAPELPEWLDPALCARRAGRAGTRRSRRCTCRRAKPISRPRPRCASASPMTRSSRRSSPWRWSALAGAAAPPGARRNR